MSSTTERSGTRDGLAMHHPPHPGEVLRELYLEPLSLTVKDAAEAIGVSRTALSTVVNGHARVSADMAARLAQAFRTSVELWLRLQMARDVWEIEHRKRRPHVRPLVSRRAAGA